MKFKIIKSKKISYLLKNEKKITLQGYAFIDQYGHCICIVYGESKKVFMEKFLS